MPFLAPLNVFWPYIQLFFLDYVTISIIIISSYFVIALARKVFVLEEEDNGHTPLRTKVQQ